MKVQTLMKQRLSSPAHRLAQVFLIAAFGLGLLWLATQAQPAKAIPSVIYVRTDGSDTSCNGESDAAWSASVAPNCAVKTIKQGIGLVTASGTVIVKPGTYEQANTPTNVIAINKPLTLTTDGGATITAHYNAWNLTLIDVQADNVTIDGFSIIVNRPEAVAGIVASDRTGLIVRNCVIQDAGFGGSFDNPYLATDAVGIAVLSANSASAESVVITNNRILISISTLGARTRSIWLRQVYGEVTNNEILGLAHDALIQFSYGGTTTVSGNQFKGAGVDITEPNGGPIVIQNNSFLPPAPSFAQSLLIKHNYNPVPINVTGNTFIGHSVGIRSTASRDVTIEDNNFLPFYDTTVFTHTLVNTAYPTSGTQSPLGGANSITFTNNHFRGSTASGLNGTAIEIRNDNSKGAVDFNPILIGGTPSAMNTFDGDLSRTVWLAANVTHTNPAINAYWNDWGNTTIEDIEAKLYHQPDDGNLAKIDFYSMTVAAAPTTQLADNVSPINVTATVTGFFTPGSGSSIAFAASSGTFSPVSAATNGAGQATALLASPIAGQTAVTVTGGVAVNHPVSASTIVTFTPATDLTISKSNNTDVVIPGDVLTYCVTVTNTGLHPADGVVVTDTLPDYTTFNDASDGGTVSNGVVTWPAFNLDSYNASATRLVTVTLDGVFLSGITTITNTAAVTDDLDFYPDNNSAQDVDVVDAAPDLEISKSDGADTVTPGATLTYQIAVTNTGNQAATGVRISDHLPANTTFVSASDGGSQTTPGVVTWPTFALNGGGASVARSVTVTVTRPFPADTNTITNTVAVADDGANGADPTPNNNTAEDVDTVFAAPDLVISKDDRRTVVQPGETLAYLVTITNTGDQNTAAVFVTDTLPISTTFLAASDSGVESAPGVVSWPAFALAGDGGRATRLVVVTVDNSFLAGVDAITNTITVTTAGELDERDNTAWDVDWLNTAPDVALAKSDGGVSTQPGATLVYTLTYTNLGAQGATGVVITETAPVNTTVDPADNPGWSCVSTPCTYIVGDLPVSASDSVTFAVDIVTPLPAGVTEIANTAAIADDGSNGADTNPANNTATTSTPVIATPDLEISKDDGVDTVVPGATLTYQITVTNSGDQGATGVRITDNLPAYTTFVAASDGGTQSALGVVTWPTFALDGGGASVTRSVTVIVANPFPADTNTITNTVAVADDGSNGSDPTPDNNTAADVDTVSAAPNLLMTKDDGRLTVVPGSTLIYQLVITNTGNQLAAGIVLTDTLPDYTAFALASDDGSESAPGIVTWPVFDLPGGASTTRLLVVAVETPLPAGVTAITNTAVLRDNRGFTATAEDIDAVDANPVLVLDKTNAITTTVPGATIGYTLTLTNNGNQAATGVLITDTLPADVAFVAASDGGFESAPGVVTWPAFDLPGGGASVTRLLTVAVNPTLPAGLEMLINSADARDDRGFTASAQHADTIIAAPDLALTKDDDDDAYPDATIAYTLTYANLGEQGATGVVIAETVPAYATFDSDDSSPGWTCLDEAPAGTTCTYLVGDLAAGASGDVIFAVTVISPLPFGVTEIDNTATLTDDGENGADTDPTNNTATISTDVVAAPDLVVSKDDQRANVQPGDVLAYLITITNTGNLNAAAVFVTDTLPANTTFFAASDGGLQSAPGVVTWPAFALAGDGGRATRLVVATVNTPLLAGVDAITNSVTAATPKELDVGDNSAWDVDEVDAAPDLALTKTDGGVTVEPGDTLAYTLTYANLGNQEATGVVISETIPAYTTFYSAASSTGWSCVDTICTYAIDALAAGESGSVYFAVSVLTPLPRGVIQLDNMAGITDDGSNDADTNPANNTATETTPVVAAPDLVITKDNGGVTTQPDATLVYTLTYANVGNQEATSIIVAESIPAHTMFNSVASSGGWTCVDATCTYSLSALAAGASGDVVFAVDVVTPLPAGVTEIANTATIADDGSNGADSNPANNVASVVTPVAATPDLVVAKSDGVDTVVPGATLTYQIVVTNSGDQGATGVRITDNLPTYTSFVAASDGGTQTAPGVVTWPAFALDGGASVTRTVTVVVANPFPADTNTIVNTVAVTDDGSNGADPTPENNTATDADAVFAAPNLLMTKDDGRLFVVPGSTLIYQLVITNTGSQLAAGIVLTDTLPDYTAFYLVSDNGSESAPGVVTWPAFNLPGGASTTRLLVVTVDTPLPAGVTAITNTAVLRDNRGFSAAAADIDAVDANPVLVLDKTNAITTTVPDATVGYTLTLTNNGNQAATGVLITDTLPADVAFVAASDGGFESAPGVVTWPAFELPGGSASVTRLLTVAVNPTLPAGLEMLINSADARDDRGFTASAQHADIVVAAPDLALTKDDGGATPHPGDVIVYTLSYTNMGQQDATGVVLAETVPAYTVFNAANSSLGWTCSDGALAGTLCTYAIGDLAAGSADSISFAVSVVTPLPSGVRQIENTASIADDGSNGADTDPANNIASAITPVSTTIDLVIGKDDGDITVEPGETLVYTLTYANVGDQIASGVIITETVPDYTTFNATVSSIGWSCTHGAPAGTVCTYALGDVIGGGALRFAVDVILPFPLSVTEITNQASIGDDGRNGSDANPDDNTATAITPVITRPDLVAGKDDGVSAVLPEQTLTYIITVANRGTQNATNVQITDTLSAEVTFVSASDGGTQTRPGVVTWPPVAQLALNETVTRTVDVMVNAALSAGVTHITNTVVVGDDGTHGSDLHPEDNTALDVDAVGAMPDLVLEKNVDYAIVYPNGLLMYTIYVSNTGSQGATGVSIIDELPSSARFVSASHEGVEIEPGVVAWPPFALSVGDQAIRTLTVRVDKALPEDYVLTNTASVSDDGTNGTDPTPENNTDTASSSIKWPVVYLPLVLRRYSVGPDLIVDNVELLNNNIVITIKNQGQMPVTTVLGFWVDLYINPSPPPTQVNQIWDPIAPYGAAWAVDREALPILPDGSQKLYLYDRYYKPNNSRLPVALRAGDILYVQVDSYNAATTYGAILEDHEMSESTYNNIVRLEIKDYYPLNPVMMMHSLPDDPDPDHLPERP